MLRAFSIMQKMKMRVWIRLSTRTATADGARDSVTGTKAYVGGKVASAAADGARDSVAGAEVCGANDGNGKKGSIDCRLGNNRQFHGVLHMAQMRST